VKVAIIGSRNYPNLDAVSRYVAGLPDGTIVVSGGALGVDHRAECEARYRGLETIIHRPAYRTFGRRAPLERNKLIVRDADRVVAFWDLKSGGTRHALKLAIAAKVLTCVFGPNGEVALEQAL
jgi:hypothetical protein